MAAFRAGPANLAVTRATLQVHNGGDSWIARQFAPEYAFHFRVWQSLPAQLRLPIPLGGTTNYFRSRMLQEVGGSDGWNVAQDADIGIRLARSGYEAGIGSPAMLAEAATRWRPWKNQRTRWIEGHMQTWLVLNRHPLRAMGEVGVGRCMSTHVTPGGGIRAAVLHGPLYAWIAANIFPEHRGVALDHVRAWLSQRRRRGSGLALDACQAIDDHHDASLLAAAVLGDDHRVIRNALQAALLVQDPTRA